MAISARILRCEGNTGLRLIEKYTDLCEYPTGDTERDPASVHCPPCSNLRLELLRMPFSIMSRSDLISLLSAHNITFLECTRKRLSFG